MQDGTYFLCRSPTVQSKHRGKKLHMWMTGGSEKPAAVELDLGTCLSPSPSAQDGRLSPPMMAIPTSVFRRQRAFFFGGEWSDFILLWFRYNFTFPPVTLPGLLLLSCSGAGALQWSGSQRQSSPDSWTETSTVYTLCHVPSKKVSTYHINRLSWKNRTVRGPVASTFPRRCAGSLRAPGILFFTAYLLWFRGKAP